MIRNKLLAISALLLLWAAAASLWSCTDIDTSPESSILKESQLNNIFQADPTKLDAAVLGMLTSMGRQRVYYTSHSDIGYPTMAMFRDHNAADMHSIDHGYNYYNAASKYTDKSYTSYGAVYPWRYCYAQMKLANDVIAMVPETNGDPELEKRLGMAYAIRAFDYLELAPYYQFKYKGNEDAPSVVIVTPETTGEQAANNPRATQREVYAMIIDDLNKAIALLEGKKMNSIKEVSVNVAYGLRARANLLMENWAEAAADAEKALEGYTPASIADVSEPGFVDATLPSSKNWMWAITFEVSDITSGLVSYISHLGTFAGYSYTEVQATRRINTLLYNQIPTTDVRRGWWLDSTLTSPLLTDQPYIGLKVVGNDIVKALKCPVYTNVKWGVKGGLGGTDGNSDWVLMRAEEMKLIQAEAKGRLNEAEGKTLLQDFVKTYRDPSYDINASPRSFLDEVWFQRRVELWGEGFAMLDVLRLGKPVVRFHKNTPTNLPPAIAFNIAADNGYLLTRITNSEVNSNSSIVQNEAGTAPKPGDNPDLRDGVTDFDPIVVSYPVTGISLGVASLKVDLDSTVILNFDVLPTVTKSKGITISIDKPSVIDAVEMDTTINKKKQRIIAVTGKRRGSATITVTTREGGFKATCKVQVTGGIPVDSVKLNVETLDMLIGQTHDLIAVVMPDTASTKSVTWASSDTAVVEVDNVGHVTAKKAGKASIIVSTDDGGKTDTCKIAVTAAPVGVTGVMLSPTTAGLTVGETLELEAIVLPADAANQNISWTSSDPDVATVDNNGQVTAIAVGSALITVTTEDGAKKAICAVKVSAATYAISISGSITNGKVTADKTAAVEGATITLTVTPADGYRLKAGSLKFNGTDVTENAGVYTFTMPAEEVEVTAEFEEITYAINIDVNIANGDLVVRPSEAAEGAEVTIVVTPAEGYHLKAGSLKFNGNDVTENAGVYTFTMPAEEVVVTAEFELNTYTIAASVEPAAGGTITGAGDYNHGDAVTLTATAEDGYRFVKWTEDGNDVSLDAAYTFTATQARTLVAEFEAIPVYTIAATVTPDGAGFVDGQGDHREGAVVNLTATANTGYRFKRWSDGVTEATRTVTVSGDATYTAEFEAVYTITVEASPAEGGNVSGGGTYAENSTATLTATANTGYTFKQWNDGSNEATRTVNVTENATYTATFELNTYTIAASANPTEGGTVTGAGDYNHGQSVTLSATANTGYSFVSWTEDGSQVSTDADYTFTAEGNRTLVANFAPIPKYSISIDANIQNGSVTVDGNLTAAAQNTEITLNVAAESGYRLKSLKYNNTDISADANGDYKFNMPAGDVTITAEFEAIFNITVAPNISGGVVSVNVPVAAAGETVTITVTPADGNQLKDGSLTVTGASSATVPVNGSGATYTFEMPAEAVTITAEFEATNP